MSTKLDVRFSNLDGTVRDWLGAVRESLEPPPDGEAFSRNWISYDSSKLEEAVSEYYRELPAWRIHFDLTGKVDRHKVAALTMHYFIKHSPITVHRLGNNVAVCVFINEIAALHIGVTRLREGSRTYAETMSGEECAAIYRMLRLHKQDMERSLEEYSASIPTFVSSLSVIMYEVELTHINRCSSPC